MKRVRLVFIGLVIIGVGLFSIPTQAVEEKDTTQEPEKISKSQNIRLLGSPSGPTIPGKESKEPEYVGGQLIVKLQEGKTLDDIQELNAKYGVTLTEKVFKDTPNTEETLKQLKDKLAKLGAEHESWYWQLDKNAQEYKNYIVKIEKEKEQLTKQIQAQEELVAHLDQRQKRAPEGVTPPNLENIYLLSTENKETSIPLMAADYKANSSVEYAEPNYIAKAQMVPNDPYYSSSNSWGQGYDDLWGLKKIQADKAWDISQGEGVIVAVVDTGIDYNHEDIAANIWTNSREIAGNGIDDDGNGFVDDIRGWDCTTCDGFFLLDCVLPKAEDNDPKDGNGHGTHCSGSIAAIGNNSKGVIGVAPKAKVMAVRALNDQGQGSDTDLVNALRYAADNGADVISNSWGGQFYSSVIIDAVNYAYSKGCVVVAAVGNSNLDVEGFCPADIPNVIAVASTDHNDQKSDFSNYGFKIDVAAPGGDSTDSSSNRIYSNILSLRAANTDMYGDGKNIVGTNYYRARGTSMACPHVSGVAALILAHKPTLNNEEIRQVLRTSADDVDNAGFDVNTGAGRINASKAVNVNSVLRVKLTWPVFGFDVSAETNSLNIAGTAAGPDFNYYELFFAPKTNLTNWSRIGSTVYTPVENGTLGTWNISKQLPTGYYVLKPVATSYSGLQFQNFVEVGIERHAFRGITTNSASQEYPAVSDKRIVWEDYRNGNADIYLYDLTTNTVRQITTNSKDQKHPAISDKRIVWEDYRNGNADIYLYDLTTNTVRQITTNSADQINPDISGNFIVWEDNRNGNYDIYLYDLTTNTERQITTNSKGQYHPAISDKRIVWEDYRNGNADIYLYDLTTNTVRQITTNSKDQKRPDVSGNFIVWRDYRNGNGDIYLYDLTTNTERKITTNSASQEYTHIYPVISGNFIVWEDYRNGTSDPDIYLYDLATNTEQQITANSSSQVEPAVSGYYLVWEDYRNGNADIYLYDTTPPSTPIVTDEGPCTASPVNTFTLKASWSCSVPETGIVEYQYRIIQDSITGTVIKDWASTGTTASVTATGLNLQGGKIYYFGVKAKNGAGLWSNIGYSDGIKADRLPTVGSVSPSAGSSISGVAVTFITTYTDPDSWQDIYSARFIIDSNTDEINCFCGYYDQNTNKLYLKNDAGTVLLGGYAPGSANVIENSYAKLDCSQTTVSGSGNTLTVNWNVSFKSTFLGTKDMDLSVYDDSCGFAGWTIKGTWTINTPPQLGSITPGSGSGLANTAVSFITTYIDADGWSNLLDARLLINASTAKTKCFYGYYNQNTNKLYLRNDANSAWLGGFAPGSSNIIENSYTKLDCSKTSVSGSGNTLTINWNTTFKDTFKGTKNTYLYIKDDANAAVGFTQKGTWTIQ
jgi:beta propeller repeat protein